MGVVKHFCVLCINRGLLIVVDVNQAFHTPLPPWRPHSILTVSGDGGCICHLQTSSSSGSPRCHGAVYSKRHRGLFLFFCFTINDSSRGSPASREPAHLPHGGTVQQQYRTSVIQQTEAIYSEGTIARFLLRLSLGVTHGVIPSRKLNV